MATPTPHINLWDNSAVKGRDTNVDLFVTENDENESEDEVAEGGTWRVVEGIEEEDESSGACEVDRVVLVQEESPTAEVYEGSLDFVFLFSSLSSFAVSFFKARQTGVLILKVFPLTLTTANPFCTISSNLADFWTRSSILA